MRFDSDTGRTYRVYGLRLWANRTIPGLVIAADAGPGDVHVELVGPRPYQGPLAPPAAVLHASPGRDEREESFFEVWRLDGSEGAGYRLCFAHEGAYAEFLIDRASRWVCATWADVVPYRDVVSLLLGPVLGCVLRIRGVTCLHASVIAASDSGAIAIIGPKFGGKSTVAAALAQHGHAVLSDDIAALEEDRNTFSVQPGCLRMRLWPSSVDALPGLAADALPRVLSDVEKRYLDLTPDRDAARWRFHPEPLPLVAVYVLGEPSPPGTVPYIAPIPAADGLVTLVRNTYVDYMLDRAGRVRDFEVLGRLADTIPLRRIHRPFDLDALPQTCKAILEDVRTITS